MNFKQFLIGYKSINTIKKLTENKANVLKIIHEENYTEIRVIIYIGYSIKELEKIKSKIENELGEYETIKREKNIYSLIFDIKQDRILKNNKNKEGLVFIDYNIIDKAFIDINKYSHIIIIGNAGTGKSYLLGNIIKDLQYQDWTKVYINEIDKNDFAQYENNYSNDIIKTKINLQIIEKELYRRKEIFNKNKAINIKEFKEQFKLNTKYIFVILDEYSFYTINKFDSKQIKLAKEEIGSIIYKIIALGRSYGINAIISTQRASNEQIDTNIRNIINNKIIFRTSIKNANLISEIAPKEVETLKNAQCYLINNDIYKIKIPRREY